MTFGGSAGLGLKDISNGHAFGSEGRESRSSTLNLDVGRMYPVVERASVRIEAKLPQIEEI